MLLVTGMISLGIETMQANFLRTILHRNNRLERSYPFRFKRRLCPGFTLVEMLIYLGLLSIFLLLMVDLFVAILNIRSESEVNGAVEQDSSFILSRIQYDLARADSIQEPAALGVSGSRLRLTINGAAYIYDLTEGDLSLTDGTGIGNLNSSETSVSALSFLRTGNPGGKDLVRVSFTVSGKLLNARQNKSKIIQASLGTR